MELAQTILFILAWYGCGAAGSVMVFNSPLWEFETTLGDIFFGAAMALFGPFNFVVCLFLTIPSLGDDQ